MTHSVWFILTFKFSDQRRSLAESLMDKLADLLPEAKYPWHPMPDPKSDPGQCFFHLSSAKMLTFVFFQTWTAVSGVRSKKRIYQVKTIQKWLTRTMIRCTRMTRTSPLTNNNIHKILQLYRNQPETNHKTHDIWNGEWNFDLENFSLHSHIHTHRQTKGPHGHNNH